MSFQISNLDRCLLDSGVILRIAWSCSILDAERMKRIRAEQEGADIPKIWLLRSKVLNGVRRVATVCGRLR